MRIGNLLVVGSVAALVAMTAPVVAKNPDTQKTDDRPTSSSCHAYQQAADGSWTERPCEEQGTSSQTQHKPVARGSEEEPR
jgi:hypothetical protein